MDDRRSSGDAQFGGSIPDLYERLLVPMIFQGPATRLAGVVAATSPRTILETAAGTGVLTRALVQQCPDARITATDLNQPMLDAAATRTAARVRWQQADALDLPFEDGSFDVVVCQFGAMFFPNRSAGYREAGRVLAPGGTFVLNVWDRIENNEVTYVIESAMALAAPADPPRFMSRTPHGYFDPDRIRADLAVAGMTDVEIVAVDGIGVTTAADAAVAFCQGTPWSGELARHPTLDVATATGIAEQALLDHFGSGTIDGRIRWFEVVARPGTA
ncbi:methyltransferase domain-containing protein [Nocardioides marmoriginsengisoli]|uniref:Methyltransferase domain-containing protein n=1 Tax=Nocardioides marmoriginsengisoli TaxID=661483 RepID=A0A3N0CH18_9ACTN|nr:class I SAM-dependent methyltransferase [Nocardioides marmoriginsengisoli]RNL62541.1 methyltransferase domain-containing protein [Nocardioides marmoriginsengisoli]